MRLPSIFSPRALLYLIPTLRPTHCSPSVVCFCVVVVSSMRPPNTYSDLLYDYPVGLGKTIYATTEISIVGTTQVLSVSTKAPCVCMDKSNRMNHPDIPLEFQRLKRKKKEKDAKAKSKSTTPAQPQDIAPPRRSEGSHSSGSGSTRTGGTGSSPSLRQDWDQVPAGFRPLTTVNSERSIEQPQLGNFSTVSADREHDTRRPSQSSSFSWRMQIPSRPKNTPRNCSTTPPEQPNPLFQPPKRKPAPLRAKQTEAPLDPSFLATEYPQLSPYDSNGQVHQDDTQRSVSQPTTPSWLARDLKRAETTHAHLLPRLQPTVSNPDRPAEVHDSADDTDFALFVAATSGLSPDQPFQRPNVMNAITTRAQQLPPPSIVRRRPSTSTVATSSSHTSRRTAESSWGVETYSSPVTETPSTVRALTGLASLPSLKPEMPPLPPLPPSEPHSANLVNVNSQSLNPLRSNPPRVSATNLPSSDRNVSPNRPNWHPIGQAQPLSQPQPSPRANLDVPPSRPWMRDNGSTISVDSTVGRLEPWARVGPIHDVSPVDSEGGDAPPPNYVASQQEMARGRQMQAARRAEELQRRWMQAGRR